MTGQLERPIRRVAAGMLLLMAACGGDQRWWKGNLHTHSLWSDGDDFPEMAVDWYRRNGYDFVALSDHNTLAEGERWVAFPAPAGAPPVVEAYRARFGEAWVEHRTAGDTLFVRLRTFKEYRNLFDEPGRFLVIQSEEITDRFETRPIHVNATNLRAVIRPQGGTSVRDVVQRNVDAVLEQRQRTGQAMFPHLNHPNFGWAVRVEDLIAIEGERFFEVYNGHPLVRNEGDDERPSTERMWDIALTERLRNGGELLYGLAVDDAHNYGTFDGQHSNPGRGWVMVQAPALTPNAIVEALEAGRFYASTGVTLAAVDVRTDRLAVTVTPDSGVTYTIQFIGTMRDVAAPVPIEAGDSSSPVSYRYPSGIGVVLQETTGPSVEYRFTGSELYVRARVVSSRAKANPYRPGEVEVAWTQPVGVRPR